MLFGLRKPCRLPWLMAVSFTFLSREQWSWSLGVEMRAWTMVKKSAVELLERGGSELGGDG